MARHSRNSLVKVAQHITPEYGAWIGASRFCILSTVGADGTDGSPRGDEGPVARIQDPQTLLMPDWRGNNRLDFLAQHRRGWTGVTHVHGAWEV